MFRLHEKTRRRICRAAFLLLCVVPTAGVSLWCVQRHLPGVVGTEARKLQRELGLDVSLRGLRYLRPGGVLYEGLELADPETGRLVLRCPALEADWRQTTDRQGRPKATLVMIASQPEIEATAADRLGELLSRLLRRPAIRWGIEMSHRRQGSPPTDVRLTAGELTLRAGDRSRTLSKLQGSIEWFPAGAQAEASFRLAGADMSRPIRVRIVRNRQTTPPTTGFELDTGGGAVPCGLLALGLPLFEQLGPRSRFRGYLWANQTGDGQTPDGLASAGHSPCPTEWAGELAGQAYDVDLDGLVTEHFPHKLGGVAQVTIHSARFRRRRLEEATGTLVAGPGVVSRSLIDAAVEHLGLVRGGGGYEQMPYPPTAGELQGLGDPVPYEQLALAFLIDSRGLRLQGACSASGHRSQALVAGAVLVGRQGRLLSEPAPEPRPVLALLRTLLPASEVQVPAAPQTDWLIAHLPVPRPLGRISKVPYRWEVPPAGGRPGLPQARLGSQREGPQ
jgi:hypothetical protein